MGQMSIWIPDELQTRISRLDEAIDWSAVAATAFAAKLAEVKQARRLERVTKRAKGLLEDMSKESSELPATELQDVREHRSGFLDRIESQALWRDDKAKEYPDDERNARSARSLRQLKQHLGDIAPEDALWIRYYRLWDHDDALSSLSEYESEELRTYGFHDGAEVSQEDAVAFLRGYVESLEELAAEAMAEAQEDLEQAPDYL